MSEKEPCPKCRERGDDKTGDNLVTHSEHGYKKCFRCDYYESISSLLSGKYLQLADRGLTKETCEKYDIQVVNYTGDFFVKKQAMEVKDHRCSVFSYYKDGRPIKQKLRSMSSKEYMKIVGNTKYSTLYGMQLFSPTKKLPIVITEGEYDAAAVWQCTQLPAVSLPNGSGSTNVLLENLEWLQEWKFVVLMFDQDEPGRIATEKAIEYLPVGTARIAHLPGKDANEVLLAGKGSDLKGCVWNAEIYRPDTIVTISDLIRDVLIKPEYGYPWPWEFLTNATYGIKTNHIYIVTGAAQVGKTEFITTTISHLIDTQDVMVGIYSLEQGAEDTVKRMVGKSVNKRLHLPSNTWWDKKIIEEKAMQYNDKLFLYKNNSHEFLSVESLIINIRYMYYCFGISVIILDNLTAMCNNPVIDGRYVGKYFYMSHIMNKLFSISRELPISLIVVAHTDNDKISRQIHIPTSEKNLANYMDITAEEMDSMVNKPGLSWDTGRMPGLGNIDGPDTIAKLSDYVIGLARNSSSNQDVIKRTVRIKLLKTRLDSEAAGKEFSLCYNYKTGDYQ